MDSSSREILSFDELIRPPQQRLRNGQAKRLRRLDVDHEIELLRQLDWQVRRLRAVQDLPDVNAAAAEGLTHVRPIGQQAAGFRKLGEERDGRQPFLASEAGDARPVMVDERRRENENSSHSIAACRLQRGVELRYG